MSAHCPSCGAEATVEPRIVTLEVATCPGCSNSFVVLPPIPPSTSVSVVGPGVAAPGETPADAGADAEDEDEELTATCAECGGALVLSVDDENVLAATCDDCDVVFKLIRADAAGPAEGLRPSAGPGEKASADGDDGDEEDDDSEKSEGRRRPSGPRDGPSFERRERPSFDRRGGDWNAPPQSRARPCRKCGGPIVFSESPDGGMVGTCSSCGNRFSLRPREDRGGSGSYRPAPRGRGPPPWKRGGGGGGGGRYGGGGDRPRSGGFGGGGYGGRRDDRSDDERPRRRRRDD
jgi:hypothetical protein